MTWMRHGAILGLGLALAACGGTTPALRRRAQTRYELGLGSIVELSQAQLNQTAAEVSSANARYEYQILRSVLRFQLGEGAL